MRSHYFLQKIWVVFFLFVFLFYRPKVSLALHVCNQACTTGSCNVGLTCSGGVCRDPYCPGETDCTCPPAPDCAISGPTTVAVNGTPQYCVSADNAPDGASINKSPTDHQGWVQPPIRPKSAPGCSSTTFAQVGTYYVVCNAYGNVGNECSGNPFGLSPPWVDCGPNDALTVNVIDAPVWNMTAHPVCANGVVPQNIQAGWMIWPPEPQVWSNDSFATGDHVVSINSSLDLNGAAYLRLQDTAGTYLPATSASNPNINVGTFFSEPGADWQRSVLPAGSYTVNYTAPAVDCPAPINGSCDATHYNCQTGTSASPVSGGTSWTWNCNGSNGGSNALCLENKPTCSISGRTPTSGCYQGIPSLSASYGGGADQIQFAVDTDNGFASPWSCNSGWQSSPNPYPYSSCSVSGTGTYYWNARSSSTSGACVTSLLSSPYTLTIDQSTPNVPSGLNATCNANGLVSASWNAATDIGCKGLDSTPYWSQASTDPTFATAYSDSSWINSWTLGTSKSTNTRAFSPGDTVYTHVRSRDGFNQQSAWSANVSCTIPPPTCFISASPANIAFNGTSTVSWGSTNTTGCTVSSPGWPDWTGTSGSQSTGNLLSTTTYHLSCPGFDGTTCEKQAIVGVDRPITPTLTCTAFTNPAQITWDWTISPGPVTYWLQVNPNSGTVKLDGSFVSANTFNGWLPGPPQTTAATPGVPYFGHVLAGNGSQSSDWSNPPNASLTSCTVPLPLPPTSGACQAFDPASASTAVNFTGMTGAGMQVVRDLSSCADPFENQTDTNKWLYVGNATSPKLVSPVPPKYMPPGHKICARTTYDWSTFSSGYEVTCPVPANPAPANISGSLEQKSGTNCYTADASHTFDVISISSSTDNVCVTSACKADPGNKLPNATATDYNCAITFDEAACLNQDRPTWPTSATVSLTGASAGTGYSFIGWTDPPGDCKTVPPVLTNSLLVNTGDNKTENLTFNFNGNNWKKTKDTSFNASFTTSETIPMWPHPFPASNDTGSPYFIIGQAGSTLRTSVSPPTAYSTPNWHDSDSNYSRASPGMNAANFISYVKSRKSYQSISDLTAINGDGIYIWTGGTLTISDLTKFDPYNVVLISNGEIIIDKEPFKSLKSLAIVADTITFTNITHKATGLFIANTINTGNPLNQGLQIVGNLIALNTLNNNRSWSDTSIPSIFVEFDPSQYIYLLPYLSTASYDWTQIQ